jgi:alkylation response protein AidB-like acyl-CoA dehydrogenase
MPLMSALSDILLTIADAATARDIASEWPADELAKLAEIGAMRWVFDLDPLKLHQRYEQIASASLAVALVLTQRDSAVQLVEQSPEFARRDELLARFAANELWTTIGIAQLTTSRQGGEPALLATETGGDFDLHGVIPWCTGAHKADFIIAGAAMPDGRQILFALPRNLPGSRVDPPTPLVALSSTHTSQVHCDHVRLDRSLVLRGPMKGVLASRKKGVPFGQVFLGLGLCRAAVELIRQHHSESATRSLEAFEPELKLLRKRVLFLSTPENAKQAVGEDAVVRADVSNFAIRTTHAAVTLYKGSALLATHPAQRLAREAMFLLVWSCPGPVIDCTLDRLIEC